MKQIFKQLFYAYAVTTTLIGCNINKNDAPQVVEDMSLSVSTFDLNDPRIVSSIKEYIDNNTGEPSRIYTMLVRRDNISTTSFQVSSIITYSELHRLIPSGFFWVDENIVLVYTGLEYLSEPDDEFAKRLVGIIGDRLANDLLADGKTKDAAYRPMVFDPSTWNVKITGDSVTVERGVMNLLGPPTVAPLEFIKPKESHKDQSH
jgi:hypothetical protein